MKETREDAQPSKRAIAGRCARKCVRTYLSFLLSPVSLSLSTGGGAVARVNARKAEAIFEHFGVHRRVLRRAEVICASA